MALPASVGFFFSTMYNVVDTWYAGLYSTEALAALSLSFPIFFLIVALGLGVDQGATALVSNALGEGSPGRAFRWFVQSISFGLLLSVLLSLAGWLATPWLFMVLGAQDGYLRLCRDYMDTILLGTVFVVLQYILNASLKAQGKTRPFCHVLIAGFLLNIVLDPWFMYGGLGLPAMGIRGLALATVVIQLFGCVWLLASLSRTPLWKPIRWRDLLPCRRDYASIAFQGLPAGLNMTSVALGIFLITWFVSRFSSEGVAAYGIAVRIEQIVLLPTIGLNIAVLALTGQNNGARRYDRIRQAINTSMAWGIAMMAAGGILLLLLGRPLMDFFTEDPEVVDIGSGYLRVAAITLCAYVVLFQTVFMLQGLKRPMFALWLGLIRQLAAPCIVFYLLAFRLDYQLAGIWWGIFLVNWAAAAGTWFYGRAVLREISGSGHGPPDQEGARA